MLIFDKNQFLELLTIVSQWREKFDIPKSAIESDLFAKIVEMCRESPSSFDQMRREVLISNPDHVTQTENESIKAEPPILT